jgi:hypothetical protein
MEYAKRNAKGLSEKMFGRLHQNEKSEIKIKKFSIVQLETPMLDKAMKSSTVCEVKSGNVK